MPKIRVLVVDDAVVMRRMISDVLARDAEIEVAGIAPNGRLALQRIPQVNPDAVILDVEMPEMNGLEALREIRKLYPKLPVIMFSTLTEKGAVTTVEALSLGASDYVTKPSNTGSVNESLRRLETELIPKVKGLCRRNNIATPLPFVAKANPALPKVPRSVGAPVEIVCIGTSTGGPNALAELFKTIPSTLPVPIVLVQHMPPVFTALLAERLTASCALKFHEGHEGQKLEAGHCYIAPGGKHMEVRRKGFQTTLHLHEGPPENSCRPAVDVLFRSVATAYGGGVLGIVLTGMGQDGQRGCEHIREHGGYVLAQDEKTSVVWGMPGSVVMAGVADEVRPIQEMAERLQTVVRNSHATRIKAGVIPGLKAA